MTQCFFKVREMVLDGPLAKKYFRSIAASEFRKQFFMSSQKLSKIISDLNSIRKKSGDRDWLQRFMAEAINLLENNKNSMKEPPSDQTEKARKLRDLVAGGK